MATFSFYSLRVRLLLLVLLALIPAFGLILYTAREQRIYAAAGAREQALHLARRVVQEQREFTAEVRRFLGELSQQPQVALAHPITCPALLAGYLNQRIQYTNLGVINPYGDIICSAVPFKGSVNAADRMYFQEAVRTRDFSVGEYQIGRITGKAALNFGYPVLQGEGKLRSVVFAALDLAWLNQFLSESQFTEGSVLLVIDPKGVILARSAEPQKWIGKPMPPGTVEALQTGQQEGAVEAAGVDGINRLYAFSPLIGSGGTGAYVGIGISPAVAYANVNRSLTRNLSLLGLVAVLALVAAWFGGDLFILRQVRALVRATERFAAGDLSARTGLSYKNGELSQLAQSFDAMGDALQTRETELRGSKEELENNLHRIRALHEIDLAISSTLDLRTVSTVLLEKVDIFFSYPTAATIRLVNKVTGALQPLACRNINESVWKTEPGRGLTNMVAETRASLAVEDIQTDPRTEDREFFRRYNLVSYLGVPLIAKREMLGVLSIYTHEKRQFTTKEIEFLRTLGGQAAIAINNSQLHEETKNRAVELGKVNKVKDEFLSVMSHELRTPLTVVMGYIGVIKDGMMGEVNSRQREALEKVMRRAHDQLYMIDSILFATSLQAQAAKAERAEISLRPILDDLRSTYEVLLEKKLDLEWDYASELPIIRTDGVKLKHVLDNLINNAIKFTERGSVTVSARHLADIKVVQFKVTDTGIGISTELLPIIFEMFRQADGSETRLHGGVGLGLYIVKKFTELLGGWVEVESEPGKGSAFTVTIPYERSEQASVTHSKRMRAA
ncbi:MAG: ATP-binding protein [Candidatus Binatia bacterium]